uniref:Bm7979, isoform a n=1 Tax=Brugia malayi TaxID=6279 RepID=A0A1I9G8N8_BRUMA|nr:Bm7979, isoform a [Brugia malayi]
MPDDEYRTKYSAAQKMQLLKSQQAKLEVRAMPAHSQLKLKVILKLNLKQLTSSSSKSKISTGSSAAIPRSPLLKSDVQVIKLICGRKFLRLAVKQLLFNFAR